VTSQIAQLELDVGDAAAAATGGRAVTCGRAGVQRKLEDADRRYLKGDGAQVGGAAALGRYVFDFHRLGQTTRQRAQGEGEVEGAGWQRVGGLSLAAGERHHVSGAALGGYGLD